MWKILRSKSIWVALSGCMLAVGTLLTAVDEAKAGDCVQMYKMYHQNITGVAGAKWGRVLDYPDGYPGTQDSYCRYDLAVVANKNFGNVEIWILSRNATDTDYHYFPETRIPYHSGNFSLGMLREVMISYWNYTSFDKWTIVIDPIVNGKLDQYVTGAVEFNWYPKNTTWMNANTTYSEYFLPCLFE